MPDVYLNGSEERTDEALSLLQRVLMTPESPSQLTVTRTDTADHECNRLDARYLAVENVFRENSQITIRPRQGLDIAIRTQPIRHQMKQPQTAHAIHCASIEHHGDFVHVVNPYYFYEDRHKVSYYKYCFHAPGLATR